MPLATSEAFPEAASYRPAADLPVKRSVPIEARFCEAAPFQGAISNLTVY